MIRQGNSSLESLGSGLCKAIDSESKTKSAKRFISNEHITYQSCYLPYLLPLLELIISLLGSLGLVIVIDGSQTGKDNATLMISLVWFNRGIPLCWLTKKGAKGHFKTKDHLKLLQQAIDLIISLTPNEVQITLLGDGEFDSIELQQLCLSVNWNYVFRTAKDTVFFEEGERFQPKQIVPDKTTDTLMIPEVAFSTKEFKWVNFVLWHNPKHNEAIPLISNIDDVEQIKNLYAKRYSIECLFRDIKSTSFNIHKTRLKNPEEVSRIILIAALAFLMLTLLALKYDQPKWRKKVQRVRNNKKVLSFFCFAFKLVHFFIDNDIGFVFSLEEKSIVKNCVRL